MSVHELIKSNALSQITWLCISPSSAEPAQLGEEKKDKKRKPDTDAKCKPQTVVTLQAFAIKKLFITAPSHCVEKHSNEPPSFNQSCAAPRIKLSG